MATLTISHLWNGVPATPQERCVVALEATADGWLCTVDAPFHGDPPPAQPSGQLDGLWLFEVVELFVAAATGGDSEVDYTEVELSPHGHFLILRFNGVRQRRAVLAPLAVECRIRGQRWQGRIELPREALPPAPWRVNAFAIHGEGASRRYLSATPLPGPGPDFHQPGSFQTEWSG